jgi:hypothetical protein
VFPAATLARFQANSHIFVMAGAVPRTDCLEDSFVLHKNGFIVTGPDLADHGHWQWPLQRAPSLTRGDRQAVSSQHKHVMATDLSTGLCFA